MEWGKSIVIILVFVMLTFYIVTTVGIKTIKENWPLYRCNPLYMPFADTLAPTRTTARENFSYCLNDFMMSAAPALTQPLSYVQTMTLAMVGQIHTSQEKSMEQNQSFTAQTSFMFDNLYDVFAGIIVQFNLMINKLVDAQSKLMGTVNVVMYILVTVQYAFMSMWNGIPGALIKIMGKQ